MAQFAPQRVCSTYHFDIRHNRRGLWTARDRNGLVGGTFRTRGAAVRFALFETGGDVSLIHEAKTSAREGRFS
jgi:hypothetical protein